MLLVIGGVCYTVKRCKVQNKIKHKKIIIIKGGEKFARDSYR